MKNAINLITALTAITIVLWIASIPYLPERSQTPLKLISQITANLTILYMSLSIILSMKLHTIDRYFKGMNTSYKIHAFIGSTAFLFMIGHPLLLVINALPNTNTAFGYVFFGTRTAANFGIAAVYLTIFAFTFMTFIKLKYTSWLTTHRLLALSFLLGSIHAFLAPSMLTRFLPFSLWMGLLILLGISGSFYSLFLYKLLGHHLKYTIVRLDILGDILNVTLQPLRSQLNYLPGQFIYARFKNNKLNNELHPFSLSSTPQENVLRLSIKALGDYTKKIQNTLVINDKVDIFGPFGNFGGTHLNEKNDLIWIAGGVGITPFLSMLHAEHINRTNKKILFYYSLNKPAEAAFDEEICSATKEIANISYIKWIADDSGFLTMDIIMAKWKEIGGTPYPKILLCGPPPMMKSLKLQAIKLGIPSENIIFEDFSFY